MKLVVVTILTGLLLFLLSQLWQFYGRAETAQRDLDKLTADLEKTTRNHELLKADYEFYSRPENLEKELRARFNYKEPDETMIVIVPQVSGTTTTAP